MPDSSGSSGYGVSNRPFSVTQTHSFDGTGDPDRPLERQRALSLSSFHTANFDQTSVQSSLVAAEI